MKIVAFYIKQIILLGTSGFLAWLCIGWWHNGLSWASDAPYAWMIALATTAIFLLLVCAPIQAALVKLGSDWVAYLAGLLSGPLGVLLYLAVKAQLDVTWHNFVTRHWMHLILGLLGLWFSFNYRRRFGPNNSFKPKPLRGSA